MSTAQTVSAAARLLPAVPHLDRADRYRTAAGLCLLHNPARAARLMLLARVCADRADRLLSL